MADQSPERVLADHVASLGHSRVPATARARAADLLLDTAACMLAGLRSPECAVLARLYGERGGAGESSAVGLGRRLPAPAAGTLNAALAHWYEWDDVHDPAALHASAVIWPVIAAAAEAAGKDKGADAGREIAATAVAAFDVAGRIGDALTPYSATGWMPTGTACTVGAAAGAARLFGLGVGGILAAMGLAAAGAGLSRQPLRDRVSGKNILCAQATARAIEAVDLARAGIVGAPDFLAGGFGLNALVAGGRADTSRGLDDLGRRFSVEEVSVKPYPCCRSTHPAVDLALDLGAEFPGLAAEARAIEVVVPRPMFDLCGAPFAPGDNPRVSAQFSIAYTVAAALRQGGLSLADFDAARVTAASDLPALAARVRTTPYDIEPGEKVLGQPVTVRCRRADGSVVERTTPLVKGSPQRPMTADETRAKLADCASGALDGGRVAQIVAAVGTLERDGLAPVMTILRGAAWRAESIIETPSMENV